MRIMNYTRIYNTGKETFQKALRSMCVTPLRGKASDMKSIDLRSLSHQIPRFRTLTIFPNVEDSELMQEHICHRGFTHFVESQVLSRIEFLLQSQEKDIYWAGIVCTKAAILDQRIPNCWFHCAATDVSHVFRMQQSKSLLRIPKILYFHIRGDSLDSVAFRLKLAS